MHPRLQMPCTCIIFSRLRIFLSVFKLGTLLQSLERSEQGVSDRVHTIDNRLPLKAVILAPSFRIKLRIFAILHATVLIQEHHGTSTAFQLCICGEDGGPCSQEIGPQYIAEAVRVAQAA
jgi:hypothetical protein